MAKRKKARKAKKVKRAARKRTSRRGPVLKGRISFVPCRDWKGRFVTKSLCKL